MIVGVIIYTFRDSAGPIIKELKETTPAVVAGICVMATVYQIIEGLITTMLAKQYNPSFTMGAGLSNSFFCSFYRVATLGSGAGIAAIIYLGRHDVEYSKGFGLYMLQYALHKFSIACYSMILFALNWDFMCRYFADYMWLLAAGYLITLVITTGLILCCCSSRAHKWVLGLLGFFNKKIGGKISDFVENMRWQCQMLEDASKYLLRKKVMVAGIILLNLIKFCFWYGIPYLIFAGEKGVTMSQTMAVTSLSVMLAAVMPAPAGIGTTEFVFTSLFSDIVGMGSAGSAALLYRFGTFVFPFLVGAVIVAAMRIHRKV